MKELETIEDWQAVLEHSNKEKVFIMKHSTACSGSSRAYREFAAFVTETPKYLLKIQHHRPISAEIERNLGIRHESPQLFLLENGKAVWQATHRAITQDKIGKGLDSLQVNE